MTKEERAAYNKAYYEANREQRKAYSKAHYEASREQRKAYNEANREQARAGELKRLYGITIDVYNTLIDGQHFLCSICHKPDFTDGKPLHVDHDHKTGWVRGLLCTSCNTSLGGFQDDPALLKRAIEYLHLHSREGRLSINQRKMEIQQEVDAPYVSPGQDTP